MFLSTVVRISVALFGVAALFGRPCAGALRTAFASTRALLPRRECFTRLAAQQTPGSACTLPPRWPLPWATNALIAQSPANPQTFAPGMSARARRRGAAPSTARSAARRSDNPEAAEDGPKQSADDIVGQLEEIESATAVLWPQKKRRSPSVSRGSAASAGKESAGGSKRKKGAAAAGVDQGKRDGKRQTGGILVQDAATDADGAMALSVKNEAKAKRMRPGSDCASSPSSSPSKKRVPIAPGSLTPPEGWKEIYDLVWELRLARDAPVDWAGCEVVGKGDEFHILVALMLSSQTKDQVVSEAMQALKAWPRGGLTVDSILAMTDVELDTMIAKVGFHNNKTKYIKQTAQILKDKHGSRVPQTAEGLCACPGIGPKMAYIILSAAFGIVDGIGVDTHMHRIFNVLNWVTSKTPEQTREQLEGWLPRSEWPHVNVLFVGLGQGTQQPAERHRLLRRCVDCSRPADALRLVHRIGADVSGAADKVSAETPLMYAVRQGNLAAVETLVALGVKLDLRNSEGKTALDLANETHHPKIVAVLMANVRGDARKASASVKSEER